jgi:hypothetical protein
MRTGISSVFSRCLPPAARAPNTKIAAIAIVLLIVFARTARPH